MKFNNYKRLKSKKYLYNVLFFILFSIFIFIAITPIQNEKFNLIKYLLLVVALMIALRILFGNEYFEYDSSGMVVILKNDSIFKKDTSPLGVKSVEFPKKKLQNFKIINYVLYKSLIVYIKSKNKGTIKKYFNITNISAKRTKFLKQSLRKILKENNSNT